MKARSLYLDSLFGLSGNGLCCYVSACEHDDGSCNPLEKKNNRFSVMRNFKEAARECMITKTAMFAFALCSVCLSVMRIGVWTSGARTVWGGGQEEVPTDQGENGKRWCEPAFITHRV